MMHPEKLKRKQNLEMKLAGQSNPVQNRQKLLRVLPDY